MWLFWKAFSNISLYILENKKPEFKMYTNYGIELGDDEQKGQKNLTRWKILFGSQENVLQIQITMHTTSYTHNTWL